MDEAVEVCLQVDEAVISRGVGVCTTASLAEKELAHPEGIEVDVVACQELVPATAALTVGDDIYPNVLVLDWDSS